MSPLNIKQIILLFFLAVLLVVFCWSLGRFFVKAGLSATNYYIALVLRLLGVFGPVWIGLIISNYLFQKPYLTDISKNARLLFLACWILPFFITLFPYVVKRK